MDIKDLQARDIMRCDVIKVTSGTKLRDLAKLLEERHITGVPVVDSSNKLVGVVSQTDIIRFYANRSRSMKKPAPAGSPVESPKAPESSSVPGETDDFGEETVDEIMTQETFAFNESVSVTKIAKAMTELHMHRAIIVDEDFNLSGVVTTIDMVRLIANLGMQA